MQHIQEDSHVLFRKARRAKGSLRAALEEELVLGHLEIAEGIARNYSGPGRDADDLKQVARLGLLKAVRGFDPDHGADFPAYAVPTVHGELKRYLRDSSWMVRPPRHLQDLRTAAIKATSELAQQLGREPRLHELADALAERPEMVAEALNCHGSMRPESLDGTDEGQGLAESLAVSDDGTERTEELLMLRGAIRELDAKEQQLLFYRYFQEESQRRIGERIGMSQMQVSRALARTLVKLQRRMLGEQPAPARQRMRTA
jgi:RNA polymerase sigma-B factor